MRPIMLKLFVFALLLSLCGCAIGRAVGPFSRDVASTADWNVSDGLGADFTSRSAHCEKRGGTFVAAAVKGRFGKDYIDTTAFQYGPNNCVSRAEGFQVESELGGNAPPGFNAFATMIIAMDPVSNVTFQGTGRTITFRSSHFSDFGGADFWLFVYDERTGNLIDSYNLGMPTGDTFTAPSLYQNGFVVPHIGSGEIGNLFELAYTYSHAAAPTPHALRR